MKHRFLSILILVLMASGTIVSITVPDLIRLNYQADEKWDWVMWDTLYNDPVWRRFKINHESDTIFMSLSDYGEGLKKTGGSVWNHTDCVVMDGPSDDSSYSLKAKLHEIGWFTKLLMAWDIDSLRKLGSCDYNGQMRHRYYYRFVIKNNHVRVDTAVLDGLQLNPGDQAAERERQIRLDSIKTAFLMNRMAFKAARHGLEVSSDSTRNLWDRIADWFQSVWKLLFG